MDITGTPQLPEPEAIHTLVVYDPKTGVIVHRHQVVTFPGAAKRSKEQLEARALEMARLQTGTKTPLAVLHVGAEPFSEPAVYVVDLKKKQLVKKAEFTLKRPAKAKKRK
jgi:hypothetical protein